MSPHTKTNQEAPIYLGLAIGMLAGMPVQLPQQVSSFTS